jgi:hypothetical protein
MKETKEEKVEQLPVYEDSQSEGVEKTSKIAFGAQIEEQSGVDDLNASSKFEALPKKEECYGAEDTLAATTYLSLKPETVSLHIDLPLEEERLEEYLLRPPGLPTPTVSNDVHMDITSTSNENIQVQAETAASSSKAEPGVPEAPQPLTSAELDEEVKRLERIMDEVAHGADLRQRLTQGHVLAADELEVIARLDGTHQQLVKLKFQQEVRKRIQRDVPRPRRDNVEARPKPESESPKMQPMPSKFDLSQGVLNKLASKGDACWDWIRFGHCPRGVNCPWKHPPIHPPRPGAMPPLQIFKGPST